MNRVHLVFTALAATLAAACSTTPPATPYATGAPVVGVNATPATSPTLSSGLNTQTTADRVVIGEPAQTTLVAPPAPTAPAGNVVGGSVMNPNPSAGVGVGIQPVAPAAPTSGAASAPTSEDEARRKAAQAGTTPR